MYGPVAPRSLPKQNRDTVQLIASRWERSAVGMQEWARRGKEAVDFVEGRHWTAEQLAQMQASGKPALTFNRTGALFRLVAGYQANNRTDHKFQPGSDSVATETIAEVITNVVKHESEHMGLVFEDQEMYMDGLMTGRGYQDIRLDFAHNDLGELSVKALDPFSVYLDPEGSEYDVSKSGHVSVSRWVSLDEIENGFGKQAANMVRPFTEGNIWTHFPEITGEVDQEISPIRYFGEENDIEVGYNSFRDLFENDFIDVYRKNIRMVDTQYWVRIRRPVLIDLETGHRQVVPDWWTRNDIQKALYHAEQIGNPLYVQVRDVRRVRWTVIVGDVIVYDDWSPYDKFTVHGFFPWFRRGYTKGMIDDLIDPQREVNKRRSLTIEIVARTTNGGWKVQEGSLSPEQESYLETYGSSPGAIIKYKNEAPQEIQAAPPPTSMERLEQKAADDLKEISGINESALGTLDRVQSGVAVEARQRQALVGLQTYNDNFMRTKKLQGETFLNLIQKHYAEERVFRIIGEDGKLSQKVINQTSTNPETGLQERLNDVTMGRYNVIIDQTPLSATFNDAQFEEAMGIFEKLAPHLGPAAMVLGDMLIDMSSMPNKDAIRQRIQQAMGIGQQQAPEALGGAPQAALPAPTPTDTTAIEA